MTLTRTIREILNNNSLFRDVMHAELHTLSLEGLVVDLGSGKKKSYAHQMPHLGPITLTTIDQKGTEDTAPIDLEKDKLPFLDTSVDRVLMCNILEHLFNYQFAVGETRRILKPGGQLIGFVPFFCHYHPGPKDFFRYTHEALELIFQNAGFSKESIIITPLGFGPFSAGYHLIYLAFPKIWRKRLRHLFVLCLMPVLLSDKLFSFWQKDSIRDFPLGYKFVVIKR